MIEIFIERRKVEISAKFHRNFFEISDFLDLPRIDPLCQKRPHLYFPPWFLPTRPSDSPGAPSIPPSCKPLRHTSLLNIPPCLFCWGPAVLGKNENINVDDRSSDEDVLLGGSNSNRTDRRNASSSSRACNLHLLGNARQLPAVCLGVTSAATTTTTTTMAAAAAHMMLPNTGLPHKYARVVVACRACQRHACD